MMFSPVQLINNLDTKYSIAKQLPTAQTVLNNVLAAQLRLNYLLTLQNYQYGFPISQKIPDAAHAEILTKPVSVDSTHMKDNLLKKVSSQSTHEESKTQTITEEEFSREIHCLQDIPQAKESKNEFEVLAGEIRDCSAFEDLPSNTKVLVQSGNSFDLRSVKIKKHVPNTKNYKVYTYLNPKSKRQVKILQCVEPDCGKHFRKWHNFFDHLRIHTKEKPYSCPYEDCQLQFTQKANLNKHIEVHVGEKRFHCPHCSKGFFTNFNLKSHLRVHAQQKALQKPLKREQIQ